MNVWHLYKNVCSLIVTSAICIILFFAIADVIHNNTLTPADDASSPDADLRLQIVTAGQNDTPPDYASNVKIYLYDTTRIPFFRRVLVGEAPYADGWSVKWTAPRAVTISLGPSSYISYSRDFADQTNIRFVIRNQNADQALCIKTTFETTIDGINCFLRLLNFSKPDIDR